MVEGQDDPYIYLNMPDSNIYEQGIVYGKKYNEVILLNPSFFMGKDYLKLGFIRTGSNI